MTSISMPMPNKPKISIVMTVFNQERFVRKAIQSVLDQSFQDFELIIWDDGSTDRSLEIIQSMARQDPRIKLFVKKHQGRGHSLSAAMQMAKGRYIGWLDSDDMLHPSALEETAAILDNQPEVGMVYTDYLVIDEFDQVQSYGKRCRIPYSKEHLLLNFMTFHFRLFRQVVFEIAGGIDTSLVMAEDYDFCLKVSENTKIEHLKKPLYRYRRHAESLSMKRRLDQIYAARQIILNAMDRRGLSEQYDLELELRGIYSLKKKIGSRGSGRGAAGDRRGV